MTLWFDINCDFKDLFEKLTEFWYGKLCNSIML